jgi:hypothetical protein
LVPNKELLGLLKELNLCRRQIRHGSLLVLRPPVQVVAAVKPRTTASEHLPMWAAETTIRM